MNPEYKPRSRIETMLMGEKLTHKSPIPKIELAKCEEPTMGIPPI